MLNNDRLAWPGLVEGGRLSWVPLAIVVPLLLQIRKKYLWVSLGSLMSVAESDSVLQRGGAPRTGYSMGAVAASEPTAAIARPIDGCSEQYDFNS